MKKTVGAKSAKLEIWSGHQGYYGIDNITTLNKHRREKHIHASKKKVINHVNQA